MFTPKSPYDRALEIDRARPKWKAQLLYYCSQGASPQNRLMPLHAHSIVDDGGGRARAGCWVMGDGVMVMGDDDDDRETEMT
jgi:hypothetical protein